MITNYSQINNVKYASLKINYFNLTYLRIFLDDNGPLHIDRSYYQKFSYV